MEFFPLLFFITICIVGVFAFLEAYTPGLVTEGFQSMSKVGFWDSFAAPRSDVGPDGEDSAYIRDPRYFADYANVSRLGAKNDFCRVIAKRDDPEDKFFACALAGSEFVDSGRFRTLGTKEGFRLSLDDYMRDIQNDGREDYCRILKWKDGSYQPVCARAQDLNFDSREVVDSEPPEEISQLIRFYRDCVLWLRFFNNMLDYTDSVKVASTGSVLIDETPRQEKTEGVEFNGADQFLRLRDSGDLSLGTIVPIRSIRAWMVWVYFEDFTNNAKIFDFGNGAGRDNVFLGLLGKGDEGASAEDQRPLLCGKDETSTLPIGPSGAQPVQEMPPQELMKSTDANVDDYTCVGFEISPRRLSPSYVGGQKTTKNPLGKGTLIYEVWDKQARKMRLKAPAAVKLKTWTHICVTATDDSNFRPNIAMYVNGVKVIEKESGWLPATSSMTNCYLGKSNWMNSQDKYDNKDELFRGRLFDFRAYRSAVSQGLVQESYDWGKSKLAFIRD